MNLKFIKTDKYVIVKYKWGIFPLYFDGEKFRISKTYFDLENAVIAFKTL
jgi:hypothetical protein